MLCWPLHNDPKQKRILVKVQNELLLLWRIQILPKWEICFFPEWLDKNSILFIGNGEIQKTPSIVDHISFHNNWRVHLVCNKNKKVIIDCWAINDKANKNHNIRTPIAEANPQILFKARFLDPFLSLPEVTEQSNWDIILCQKRGRPIIFSCWLIDGQFLNNAISSWIDPFWLRYINKFSNTHMERFWEFTEISWTTNWKKWLFLVLREFEESAHLEEFKNDPHCITISKWMIEWSIPY